MRVMGCCEVINLVLGRSEYTEKLIGTLVGLEIKITRIVAKNKANQNHPDRNREGVIAGLKGTGDTELEALADLIPKAST